MSVGETLAVARGIIDLWCFFYGTVDDSESLTAYMALLTPDEQERYHRFHFEQDRRMFLATRALVRSVLSNYAPVEPGAWRFTTNEHGKPHLAADTGRGPLYFNLTNTAGLVACAVSTLHSRIGIDAEALDRPLQTVGLADQYFSPSESRALYLQQPAERRERFFCYWTLKESYIKARGLGLALPLDQFSFLLDEGPEIGIKFEPQVVDDPGRWRFALVRASQRHIVAVGVDTGGARLSLRATNVLPLRGVVP